MATPKNKKVIEEQKEKCEDLLSNWGKFTDDETWDKIQEIRSLFKKIERPRHKLTLYEKDEWDEYFMGVACLAALRSKDPRTPVGACIVTADNTIVGIGYNSMPYIKGSIIDDHQDFTWKGSQKPTDDLNTKYPYVVHAAVNAITNSSRSSLEDCTIYLTHYLDEDCAHAIILSGINEVKYEMFTRWSKEDKQKEIESPKKLLESTQVTYSIKKEPQVTVGDSSKKISLSERIKHVKKKSIKPDKGLEMKSDKPEITSGEPEKDLVITWDQFFMSLALLSAKKNGEYDRQPQYKKGACIVSEEDKRIISVGFSGYPEKMKKIPEPRESEDNEKSYICHAEYKAILTEGTPSVKGYTLYVTKYPCNICAKVIVQSGINKVVYLEPGEQNPSHPKFKMYEASRRILNAALPLSVHPFAQVTELILKPLSTDDTPIAGVALETSKKEEEAKQSDATNINTS